MAAGAVTEAPAVALERRRPRVYYGWYIVSGAVIAQFISAGIQVYVNGVFLVPMTEALNWTRTDYTFAQTLGPFFGAAAGFFVGVQIDRRGARPLMLIGVTLMAISLFLIAEITALWQWLLLRGVLMTIGAALVGNLVVNVTLSKWFVERRGRAIGIAAMGTSLAGVVLAPLSAVVVDTWGWEAGWRVLGVVALLMIYPTALVMRRQPEDYGLHPDGKSNEEVRAGAGAAAAADFANSFTRSEALRTPSLYMLVVAFGLAGAGMVTVLLQTIPFLTDLGHSRALAVMVISGSAIPAVILKPVWGYMAERYHPRRLAAFSFLLLSAGVLTLLAGGHSGSTPVLVLAAIILGVGWGGLIPLSETVWASYFGRRYLGSVRSVAMPFSLVFSGGTPLLTSFYFDRVGNYDGALVGVAVAWALAAAIIVLSRNPTLPRRVREGEGRPASVPLAPGGVAAAALAPNGGTGGGADRGSLGGSGDGSGDGTDAPTELERPAARRRRGRDYMANGRRRPVHDYMQPDGETAAGAGQNAGSQSEPAPHDEAPHPARPAQGP